MAFQISGLKRAIVFKIPTKNKGLFTYWRNFKLTRKGFPVVAAEYNLMENNHKKPVNV